METLRQDVLYALRGFRRQPAFALAVISALTLGIGSNTVIFSIVNAILLHPLSLQNWQQPDRVVMLWEKNPALSQIFANTLPVRPQNFRAWKERSRSFVTMAALQSRTVTLTGLSSLGRKPEQMEAAAVTPELFPLIGIRPHLGRNFNTSDGAVGAAQVALLSDELFRTRFQGDARVLGSALISDGKPTTIVGVLPPGIALPATWGGQDQKKPKLWTALTIHPEKKADEAMSLFVFARLKDGVSVTAARAELAMLQHNLAATSLEAGGMGINATTLLEANTDKDMRHAVLVLQIAVAFVLLIACANAGNLLLTRAVARDKEFAVRIAIGASGFRLLRQTFTESVLLSAAAGLLGVLLSLAAIRLLTVIAPPDAFALHELRIDGAVLAFTAAIALATGLLFGTVPFYHSWKKDINEVLNRSARSIAGSSNRLRSGLVVSEVALSLVLVVGAGLMLRSLASLMSTDLGIRIDHLLVLDFSLPDHDYASSQQIASFNNRMLASVRAVTGVQSAALTSALSMRAMSQQNFEIPGRPLPKNSLAVTDWARVSDQYFETLRMRLFSGRTLTASDVTSEAPSVAVANKAFASAFFPNANPLGQVVKFPNENGEPTVYRIVGVVANEHQLGPDTPAEPELYLPGNHLRSLLLVVRTAANPLQFAGVIKACIWNIDRNLAFHEVITEEAALRDWTATRRFNLSVLLSFAGIAMLLSAFGLYSVLAYTVTLRTREIGIRIAIGADSRTVTKFILRNGLILLVTGILIGTLVSLALTRYMAGLIYGVNALDPLTFGSVVALLLAVGLLASYLPAVRASRIDPIEALRVE